MSLTLQTPAAKQAAAAARRAKFWDLAAAAPLIFWYGLVAVLTLSSLAPALRGRGDALTLLSHAANAAFLLLVIVLLLVRRPAVSKLAGFWPQAAALAGVLAPLLLLALPPGPSLSPQLAGLSLGLSLAGTLGAIVCAAWLGRCFGVLPQARGLVTGGPYRCVRHPLYLFELIGLSAALVSCAQPWATLVFLFAAAAQAARMIYEERALADSFPEYRAYAARTARLIPFLY